MVTQSHNYFSVTRLFSGKILLYMTAGFVFQVGLVDLDICGPSVPKLMAVEGKQVINSPYGWTPLK